MKDGVAIIGAGTAGLILGRNLSRRGIKAAVYDQKSVLGVPVRASGIVSINGLRSMGIESGRAVTNTLRGARIHSGRSVMRILSKEPVARVLDRRVLAEICADEAEREGAALVKETRITGGRLDEMCRVALIAGADGPVSTVASHFGMGAIGRHVLTYKAEFNVSVADPESVDLFFDNREFPGLFAWACPNSKDILEIGVGIDSRRGNSKKAFERFVGMAAVKEMVDGSKRIENGASMIPMQLRESIVDADRGVMLIGDAAGQVKGTTGGGIVYGTGAASVAADVICRSMKGECSIAEYERLFRKGYGREIMLHSMINRVYSSLGSVALGRVIKAMNFMGIDSFFSKYGDMDLPSLVIKRFFVRGLA